MNKKIDILSNILGRHYQSGSEYLFSCPYCKHHRKKMSVNIDRNVYKCWICDTRGKDIFRLVRRFGTFKDQENWKELSGIKYNINDFEDLFETNEEIESAEEIVQMPQGFQTLTGNPISRTEKRIMSYLTSRGLTKKDVLKWKIGYTTVGRYKNRVIIPSFNKEGDLNYFIARTFVDDYMRYLNPPVSRDIIFNELYVDFTEEITLVEGVFDAIKATNSIPILGSSIRDTSKIFKKIVKHDTPVLLALDPDASKKASIIKNLFLKYGIEVREIEYPEDRKDLGEMSHDEVRQLMLSAPFINSNDRLISALAML